MTLSRRDEFAARAMVALIEKGISQSYVPEGARRIANELALQLDRTAPASAANEGTGVLKHGTMWVTFDPDTTPGFDSPVYASIDTAEKYRRVSGCHNLAPKPEHRPEIDDDGRDIRCASGDGELCKVEQYGISKDLVLIKANTLASMADARLFAYRILRLCDEIEGK